MTIHELDLDLPFPERCERFAWQNTEVRGCHLWCVWCTGSGQPCVTPERAPVWCPGCIGNGCPESSRVGREGRGVCPGGLP